MVKKEASFLSESQLWREKKHLWKRDPSCASTGQQKAINPWRYQLFILHCWMDPFLEHFTHAPMTRSCFTHARQSHPSPAQSHLFLALTRTGDSPSWFQPIWAAQSAFPHLPPCALTRACCTLGSPSLCRRRRSSSRSRRGSRCPRLRLSPAPPAPWAHTSQTCSAAREGDTWQRWDCAALHYERPTVTSLGNETQPRLFLSHTQWFCHQIKLNCFYFCLSPPYFSFFIPLNGKVKVRC